MNNLCGNCKFWGKEKDVGEFRQCQAIIHDKKSLAYNHWQWEDEDEFEFDTPEEKQKKLDFRAVNKAIVEDGSGYYAAIKTKEDFGCVLFEEKINV